MVMGSIYSVLWVIGEIFWLWMIIDCIMNEPDKLTWLLILFFFNIPAAIIYFIMRKPVSLRQIRPGFMSAWSRGAEIRQAESDAYNLPNAYNLWRLAEIYFETGNVKKAAIYYARALEQKPDDVQSLWGAARVDMKNNDYEAAKQKLAKTVKLDPELSYGEPLLAYGKSLFETGDLKNAKKQLEKYLEKRSHPEAKIMMAQIMSGEGAGEAALEMLEEAIMDIKGAPGFYYNRNRKWLGKIKGLMNRIKSGAG
jgi:hypothetical protein